MVVQILNGNLRPTHPGKAEALLKNWQKYFIENLNIVEILPDLLALELINKGEYEKLLTEQLRRKAVMELLMLLPNRQENWLLRFLMVLKKNNQGADVDKICPDAAAGKTQLASLCTPLVYVFDMCLW